MQTKQNFVCFSLLCKTHLLFIAHLPGVQKFLEFCVAYITPFALMQKPFIELLDIRPYTALPLAPSLCMCLYV